MATPFSTFDVLIEISEISGPSAYHRKTVLFWMMVRRPFFEAGRYWAMGRIGSDNRPCSHTPAEDSAAQQPRAHSDTSQFMGPQDETLDRLLGRTEAELGAAKKRSGWTLLAVLRAAYRARTSDPKR